MKTAKKVLLLIFIVFAFISFCSCERFGTEIEDMMIIEGIGVDKTDEGYKVTIEMLNNKQSASADSSNLGEDMTLVYSAEGRTVSEALRVIINKTGTVPIYTHNKVIILGETAINENISEILDFFERDYTTEPITLMCVSRGVSAEDVLKTNIGADISKSETLEKILNQSSLSSVTPKMRLLDIINVILDETACIALPVVTIEKNEDTSTFFVDSTAIFDYDNSFVYYVDRETSEGLVKLSGQLKNGTLVTEDENNKKATFIVVDSKTRYNVLVSEDGKITFEVKIKMFCDLNEYEGSEFKSIEAQTINSFKNNIKNDTEASLQKVCNTIINNGAFDVFRFGRRLFKADMDYYNNVKGDWQNTLKNSELKPEVEVVIRRIGEESYYE